MDLQNASLVAGCPMRSGFDPRANPYRAELALALGLLVAVFVAWRRYRPRPHPLLRAYAGSGATVALLAILFQTCDEDRCVSIRAWYGLALKGALLVAASLLLELVRSRRKDVLARAVARRRSRPATGS